jgi:hypothetical protein
MCELLLRHGATLNGLCAFSLPNILFPDEQSPDYEDAVQTKLLVSPLIKSIYSKDLNLAKMLVKDLAADINFADSAGRSALMHAVKMVRTIPCLMSPWSAQC